MSITRKYEKESIELKAQATDLGLCFDWRSKWGNPSADELCEMYIRGLDFCIEHNYPSVAYMKKHFDGVMQKHGIYADDVVSLVDPRMIVCNGCTTGEVKYRGFAVGWLHIRHTSHLTVDILDHAIVNIIVYDDAKIEVHNNSANAQVSVILHGGTVEGCGNIRIRDKR